MWDNNYKIVQYRKQMKETGEIDFGNLFLYSTLTCQETDTLSLHEFFRSWNSVIIKRKKKSHPHYRRICVTWETIILSCFYYWKLFSIYCKISTNYPLRRVIAVTLQVQLYLNHSPQWIFFFQCSSNLEIFFWKITSEMLLRHLYQFQCNNSIFKQPP